MKGSDFMITVFRLYRQCNPVAFSPALTGPILISRILIREGHAPKLPASRIVLQVRVNAETF